MPKFCATKASLFSDYEIISKVFEQVCESVIPWLGIDPGVEPTPWYNPVWEVYNSFTDLHSCWFQILFLLLATTVAFVLGIYVR